MKNTLGILALLLAMGFNGCQKKAAKPEEELAALKKQQSDIQAQIAVLETSLKAQGKLPERQAAAVPVTVTPVQ
ncbi:MAG: efflux RND transporter periplasmic adaptor subunit, partial [Adhaeribacter sp.]